MFNNSKISVGVASIVSVLTKITIKDGQPVNDDPIALVVMAYKPKKSIRTWNLVFEVKCNAAGRSSVAELTNYLHQRYTLDAEIVGLGSWLPIVDTFKHFIGLTTIKISESDIHYLAPRIPVFLG